MKKCALVLNGKKLNSIITEPYIICADGGYNLITNQKVDVIIGDLDSICTIPTDIEIITHPKEKDKTDAELAVDLAKTRGYRDITIFGALDGRFDHILGNLNLLGYCHNLGITAKIVDGKTCVYYLSQEIMLDTDIGDIVSMLSLSDDTVVSSNGGLQYPLTNASFKQFSSLCISNIAIAEKIFVKLSAGKAYLIHITR